MSGRHLRTVVAVTVLIFAAAPAYAGGWSIITVNYLPDYAVAGKPITLTFSVRQHGHSLISGLQPRIQATTPQGLESKAVAVPTRNTGEYAATLVFSGPGEWTIGIDGGFNPSDTTRAFNAITLLPLTVVPRESEPPSRLPKMVRGERLFVSKGCAGCHGANSSRELAGRHFTLEYLTRFLADPSIGTGDMPNLNLKHEEIAALAEFVSGPVARR